MRTCPHTGLSTRFRMYYECTLCMKEERMKMQRLLQRLNPLRWFSRARGAPVGPDGRERLLPVRDGGVGVLESAEKPPSLCDINRIADLMRYYQQRMIMPGPTGAVRPRGPNVLPPDRPDYSSTILR